MDNPSPLSITDCLLAILAVLLFAGSVVYVALGDVPPLPPELEALHETFSK
jgi:hypothetical protein